MKPTTLFLSILASAACAQPHGHLHRRHKALHAHRHEKRGVVTTWVTETVYETVTALVDDTTTQLIMPSSKTVPAVTTSSTSPTTTSEATTTSTTIASPTHSEPVEEPETTTSPEPAPLPTTSEIPKVELPPPPPIVEKPSLPPPPPPPAPTTTTISIAPPPPPPPTAGPQPTETVGGGDGSGGGNPRSTTYSGDLTYFDLGLGSCGFDDSGKDETEHIVAVSAQLMGVQSNGNPMCGKTITVRGPDGKTVQAIVHDKCPGCAVGDIDGSRKLFIDLFGSLDAGRQKIEWWFN